MPNRCIVMGCSNVPDNMNYITLFGYPKDPVLKRKWTETIQSTRVYLKDLNTETKSATACVCSALSLLSEKTHF